MVVAGGCDYYPGSATSSPGFSFSVLDLRLAGDGDLLARIERLRKQLDVEGLLETPEAAVAAGAAAHDRRDHREGGKARDDVLAALARRGWAGRLVWGFAPVQDRHAAPAIVRALGELVAVAGVEVVIVARGGGSLADLLCFCDETLCRTVALLGVPVIASVGHHTDRTLLDDVAAVSCSTPTHAAEAAVRRGLHARPRRAGRRRGAACATTAGRAVLSRARTAAERCSRRAARSRAHLRAPSASARLHQQLREIRAGSRRRVESERRLTERRAVVLERKAASFAARLPRAPPARARAQLALALAGHDPQRTLERGYVLAQSADGEPIVTRRGRARRRRAAAALRRRLAAGEDRRAMSDAGRERRPATGRAADLRGGGGARRGDHPPPGLRRGEPRRDARAGQRGQDADRAVRQPARGGRRRARGAAPGRARQPAGSARPARVSTWETLAGLRARDRGLRARAAAGDRVQRVRAQEHGHPPARRRRGGARRGRHLRRRRPRHPAGGRRRRCRWRDASRWRRFCEHLAGLQLFPSRPSARSPAATARGRTSRRRSTSRCARPARRCTGRSGASRSRCASWSRCASASRRRSSRCAGAWSSTRRCASSSTRPARGTSS